MSEDMGGLTDRQIQDFIDKGFVAVEHAFDEGLARECREQLWATIGLSAAEPEGWTQPVVRVPFMASEAFRNAANTSRLHTAYDQLVGAGRWIEPVGMGSIPIRFPSTTPTGDDGWHVDMSFGTDPADFMEWRINIKSRGRALVMLFLLSDTGPDDAPTRLRAGSHAIIARTLMPYGDAGLSLRELSHDGYASSADCEEAWATGKAGTVYLCHPFLVHAAQPHRGSQPRFMGQPALLPKIDFDPALAPSPVQMAIRNACDLNL